MNRRLVAAAVLFVCFSRSVLAAQTDTTEKPSDKRPSASSVQYLALDAPAGMSQAVIVQDRPLMHTRQVLPLDREGKLVGENDVAAQIEQVLDNLAAILDASQSALDQLVRLNVYAIEPETIDRVREHLRKRLAPSIRPAITAVLTPLAHRDALVAVDAVALSGDESENVALHRADAVSGSSDRADAAVLPRGPVAYVSGVPAEGSLAHSAVSKSMSDLLAILDQLKLSPAQVVQLKVFLRPATGAEEVLRELKKFFPHQLTPPVVFVEWLASPQIEIEAIVALPGDGAEPVVEYYNPADVRPSPTFSRVALLRDRRQIYISSLYSHAAENGDKQAQDAVAQLQIILQRAGSDLRHLVKATYYVSDDDSARGVDRVRLRLFDPQRAPAASKVMVHGAGRAGRTLTMDMIAVGSGP